MRRASNSDSPATGSDAWGAGALVALGVLVLGKLKFLLLGLTKATTLLSMLAFAGLYWNIFGWPMAIGLVVSIYIHEIGHVVELKRAGIEATAPMFIPGIGALIQSKRYPDDPKVEARIGLAGPVWGLGAALVAFAPFSSIPTVALNCV